MYGVHKCEKASNENDVNMKEKACSMFIHNFCVNEQIFMGLNQGGFNFLPIRNVLQLKSSEILFQCEQCFGMTSRKL